MVLVEFTADEAVDLALAVDVMPVVHAQLQPVVHAQLTGVANLQREGGAAPSPQVLQVCRHAPLGAVADGGPGREAIDDKLHTGYRGGIGQGITGTGANGCHIGIDG